MGEFNISLIIYTFKESFENFKANTSIFALEIKTETRRLGHNLIIFWRPKQIIDLKFYHNEKDAATVKIKSTLTSNAKMFTRVHDL